MKAISLTAWGGGLAVCGGVLHTVVAALMRRDAWEQIIQEGFFNTVTIAPSPDQLAAAEAFWFSPGSFGVPLFLLGSLVLWTHRQGLRVPGWIGAALVAWAALLGLLSGFDVGTMTLILIGALLSLGGRQAHKRTGVTA